MENKEKIEDLIESSLGDFNDKKMYNKNMSQRLKEAATASKVDAAMLRRCKDYLHYRKLGWLGGPLELDPKEKFKDRVSPVFIKLLAIIDDLMSLGKENLLDVYMDALAEKGIKIDYSEHIPTNPTASPDDAWEAVEFGSQMQGYIRTLADRIRDEDSVKAEELGFGPKNEYPKLIQLLDRKKNGNDIEDTVQDKFTKLILAQKSYEEVQTKEM